MAPAGSPARLQSPPGKARPPDGYQSWDDYMADFELAETSWRCDEARRGVKALRLATSPHVYHALMAGQPVPADALDQGWAARYGL